MVVYRQLGFQWIVCVTFLFVFKGYNGSGVVEVRLLSTECSKDVGLNRSCCDESGSKNRSSSSMSCSRELVICLVKGIKKDPTCLSENHTISIPNFCNQTLNTTRTLSFGVPWAGISLHVVVHQGSKNECSSGRPIMVYNNSLALHSSVRNPQLYSTKRNFTKGAFNLKHSNISYEYSVYCDQNFYEKCDKYCQPGNATTNCTEDGTNNCKSGTGLYDAGWTGNNCTVEGCFTRDCKNNGSCVKETCHCEGNYTEIYCESLAADLSLSTSSTKYLITSTLSEGELKGQHANPNNNTAMYAGIGVGIVLAIALAAVIAYVILRKKHRVGHKNFKKSDQVEQDGTDSGDVKRQTDSGK